MGNETVKTRNIKIAKIISEQNLILLNGSVPGSKGSYVIMRNNYETGRSQQRRQKTGRQVELSDAIFGIEPNDHSIYLSVKQYRQSASGYPQKQRALRSSRLHQEATPSERYRWCP